MCPSVSQVIPWQHTYVSLVKVLCTCTYMCSLFPVTVYVTTLSHLFVHLAGTYGVPAVYQALGHSKFLMKFMVKPSYIDMEVHDGPFI